MGVLDKISADYAAKSGRKISVPEWGVDIYHNPLTLFDRKQLNKGVGGGDEEAVFLNIVIQKSLDEGGKRIFNDNAKTRSILEGKADATVITRIIASMQEVPTVAAEKNA